MPGSPDFRPVALSRCRFNLTVRLLETLLCFRVGLNGTVVANRFSQPHAGRFSALGVVAQTSGDQDKAAGMIQDVRPRRYDGVRVLIADDSSINRRLCRLLLEMVGCRTTCVATGFEAVETFRDGDFDLVLMDCNLPALDGYQATEAIRNIEHARGSRGHIPIVAVTAFALPTDRNYCIRRGMDDCLIKPLRKERLVEMLGRWLNVQSLSA